MCCGCWEREGSPKTLPLNFEEFKDLYDAVYVDSSTGGGLHIQLDDMNLEDDFMEPDPCLTHTEGACLAQLRKMTEAERYASLAKIDGCF